MNNNRRNQSFISVLLGFVFFISLAVTFEPVELLDHALHSVPNLENYELDDIIFGLLLALGFMLIDADATKKGIQKRATLHCRT